MQCNTIQPRYVAPEILKGKPYDTRCDIWSVGCMVFIALGGYPPFQEEHVKTLYRKIQKGKWKFDKGYWDHASEDALNFIRKLMVVKPEQRYDADAALADEWIGADAAMLAAIDREPEPKKIVAEMKKFDADTDSVTPVMEDCEEEDEGGTTESDPDTPVMKDCGKDGETERSHTTVTAVMEDSEEYEGTELKAQ